MVGQTSHKSLKIVMKSAWGSDDPTKAAFPFLHGLALAEAGHQVQIFLLGEAVSLMRKTLANAVTPVGWPPLGGTLDKVAAKGRVWGVLSRQGRDRSGSGQLRGEVRSPAIFVSLIEWADHVITE